MGYKHIKIPEEGSKITLERWGRFKFQIIQLSHTLKVMGSVVDITPAMIDVVR